MAQGEAPVTSARVARTVSGNSPLIIYAEDGGNSVDHGTTVALGVAASTSTSTGRAIAGSMVYMSGSRTIRCYPGDMTATGYDAVDTRLLGLLLDDLPDNATGNRVAIAAAVPDTIFECSVMSETATTTATTTASLVGMRCNASVNGSRFFLDLTASVGASISGGQEFVIVDVN
ncbi:MAG: hypothetical protein ACYTEU_09245, partial [Planctomycetota bacterium]